MEAIIDWENNNRASFHLQNHFSSQHHGLCIFFCQWRTKGLITLWVDSYAGLARTWLVTAEMYYSLPNSVQIHCLISINGQQVLMNVNGHNFFLFREFNYTFLLYMSLQRCQIDVQFWKNKLLTGWFNFYCHVTICHWCSGPA